MTAFTPLEYAVLDAICEAQSSQREVLRSLIKGAQLASHENTGHGFYTRFEVAHAPAQPLADVRRLDGPFADMADMGEGMTMGFILWCKDGYPDCLEGYQNCDDQGATVDLKQRDLGSLAFTRLWWFPFTPKPNIQ